MKPQPYHIVNILLHAANAALVLWLLRRLQIPGAGLAALLWAIHPVCVESVAWITELKNVQSTLFFLLALLVYLQFEKRPNSFRYAVMLLCAFAAMLSKSSTVILPGVILLIIWWQRGRWQRTDWWRVAPLLAGGLIMAGLTIVEQRYQIGRDSHHDATLNLLQRFLLAGKAGWFYLGKLCWLADLTFLYPHWEINLGSFLNWLPIVGAMAVTIVLLCLRRHAWSRASLLGLGYFALALLPVLGFFDLFFFRYSYVADHFQYLAAIARLRS